MALRTQFASFIDQQTLRADQPTLGMLESDGTYTIDAPGNDGYDFVTYGGRDGFGGVVGIARNFYGGPAKLPVWVKTKRGIAEVTGNNEILTAAYQGGGNPLAYSVPRHTHAIGSGNVDPVEGLRFIPGLVRPYKEGGSYGLKVYIEPCAYKHLGTIRYWPGQDVDLTSYRPASANTQAWVVIGLDPTTNTPTAVTGTEYALAVTMTPAQLDLTDLAGYIPLAAVVLQNGQTAINNFKAFVDLRAYISGTGATSTPGEFELNASDMWPSTTNGCAAASQTEYTTNDVDLITLDFDPTNDEFAQGTKWMPADWDAGTLTAAFAWTAASGSGDVIWGIQGRAYADDQPIDAAWGTPQTVTDTLHAAGDMHYSDTSAAFTLAGPVDAGQVVQLRVYRDADAGGDTLNADAMLISVKVYYAKG